MSVLSIIFRQIAMPVKKFRANSLGTTAIAFSVTAPVLLAIVGGAIDYAALTSQRSRLQSAVDAAALAGAQGLSLSDAKRENVSAVVDAVVQSYVRGNLQSAQEGPVVATVIRDNPLEVEVRARQKGKSYFGNGFGLVVDTVAATATARVVGQPNICVLGLSLDSGGTISLEQQARVTGLNCSVFSNSSHRNAIKAKNSASLTADIICSVGGKSGGPGNFNPEPLTDCPGFDDPLASRPEPLAGPCDASKPTMVETDRVLYPGTYCGGLMIKSSAQVTLEPGVYVIKDGPLIVTDTAGFSGEQVGIFFAGADSTLTFDRNSMISLTAPTSGIMAGLLLFSSRTSPTGGRSLVYKILSDDARVLLGTIYLPKGELHIDADSPVADKSAYTAIIADKMRLFGGPHLVLNTDYDQTDVPVPAGIKGAGQPVRLVK